MRLRHAHSSGCAHGSSLVQPCHAEQLQGMNVTPRLYLQFKLLRPYAQALSRKLLPQPLLLLLPQLLLLHQSLAMASAQNGPTAPPRQAEISHTKAYKPEKQINKPTAPSTLTGIIHTKTYKPGKQVNWPTAPSRLTNTSLNKTTAHTDRQTGISRQIGTIL